VNAISKQIHFDRGKEKAQILIKYKILAL